MKKHHINRRQLGLWAAAALAAMAPPVHAQATVRKPYLADMHSHYGMFLPRLFGFDLARHMQGGNWRDPGYIARSLSPASAKKIAARGGAVGLWTLRIKSDPAYPVHSVKTFADETMRMCDLLGPDHVAFGTDMEGTGPGPILSNYVDLREVADNLGRRGLSEPVLNGVFIGNYARIVKQSMSAAKP
jgi:hypothetical protein